MKQSQNVSSAPWAQHALSLLHWIRTDPDTREWKLSELYPIGEQADCFAREYLANHQLEDTLADNHVATYIAYSVAEMMVVSATTALEKLDVSPEAKRRFAAEMLGSAQRLFWHAARHVYELDEPEPYGESIDHDQLPPMTLKEK